MKNSQKIKHSFVRQVDSTDCGPACLLALIKYYEGASSLERIRAEAGTARDGTTLYGLVQAAARAGFDAEGCEGSIDDIIKLGEPVILHTRMEGSRLHYVVCYGKKGKHFVIGDPAVGIREISVEELDSIWVSRKCLTLRPNILFVTEKQINCGKAKWLLELIRDDYPALIVSVVLGIFVACLGIVMATFTQQLIDKILPANQPEFLLRGLAIVLVLLTVHLMLASARKLMLLFQSRAFNKRIVTSFFSALLELPMSFFYSRKIGDMIARLNDTVRIQKVVTLILGAIIIDSLTILVTLAGIHFYSPKAGLIMILFLPLYGFLLYYHRDRITEAQQRMMHSYAETESNFINTLLGVATIKNQNKQELFSERNDAIYTIFQNKIVELGLISIRLGAFSGILSIVFLVGIVGIMAFDVMNGSMTTGHMIGIIGMMGILLPAVSNLSLVAIPIKEASVAFNRMFEFLKVDTSVKSSECAEIVTLERLSIRGMTFGFPGRKRILNEISFNVSRGEIVSISGDSGSGKSTLLQILQKFYSPGSGDITINENVKLDTVDPRSWHKIIGVVPQEIHIFNGSVLYNIGFPANDNEAAKVIQACEAYGFSRFIEMLPQGYRTIVGEQGINLSGGQKQIIALARALAHDPQLLILDEATSALDVNTENFVARLVRDLGKKIAIVLVSHRLNLLRNISDRIYTLENGELLEVRRPDSVHLA